MHLKNTREGRKKLSLLRDAIEILGDIIRSNFVVACDNDDVFQAASIRHNDTNPLEDQTRNYSPSYEEKIPISCDK